jgi:hypothetical protein
MEFLNPTALYGLLALPLLLIPYLIRRRPQRQFFSSLLLFIELGSRPSGRPWGRLRLPPVFFLQLLLLTLLILALAEPVFSVRPTHIAIVLDNSASMQTQEDGKPRFVLAKEKARAVLMELRVTGKVDLYLTVPRLEKIRSTTSSPSDAAGAIAGLEPYDLGDVPVDYNNVLSQMAREQKYDRVYLITDHPSRGQADAVRVLSVGQPKGNLALTSLQVRRSSLANARLEAAAEVTNYSAKDERIKVVLRGSGTVLSGRELVVGAGKSASAAFEGFASHPYYEAEIELRDALQLDNRRFAAAPTSSNLRILAVSPRPQELASLRSIASVTLDLVSPADYEKTERTGYGLEIFHFATSAALPRTPALFVLPPDASALVDLEKPIVRPVVSSWREPHALTRYVNFSLFRPSYGRPLKPQAAGEAIIETTEGPLAFAVERQGVRHLVLGFDPFPYLGRENLPMSIFTLNFLDWFFESSRAQGKATGQALPFVAARQGDLVVTPKGEKISLKPGANYFSGTFHQGIYQINRGGENELFAVNLHGAGESDLRDPSSIEITSGGGGAGSASGLFSYWPYLLLASLLLLLIEWYINPRMAGSGLRLPAKRILSRS